MSRSTAGLSLRVGGIGDPVGFHNGAKAAAGARKCGACMPGPVPAAAVAVFAEVSAYR